MQSLAYEVYCSKIAEAEPAVSVNEKKWLVMHMHVQLKLDEVYCRALLQACLMPQVLLQTPPLLLAHPLLALSAVT
jgi:hypothetical protein